MHPKNLRSLLGWTGLALLLLLGFGRAATAAGGGFLLQGPPLGTALLVGAGLVVLGVVFGPDGAPLLPLAPLVLVSVLGVRGTGGLTGPPLLGLGLGGVSLLARRGGGTALRRAFFPLVLVLYAVVAHRVQASVGAEGDEPHYLMVADSLLRDHTLSPERAYREGRYRPFHQAPLEPHFRVRGRDGRIFSLHAVGLSILLLPAYALGGYPSASFFMALLAALLALEIRGLVAEATGEPALADGVGWIVALSPPLLSYAGLLFTEVPAALAVARVLRLSIRREGEVVSGALGLALLPWLNVRYAPLAVLLLLLLAWRRRGHGLVISLPLAASVVGLGLYHEALYGFFDPRRVYGKNVEISALHLPAGLLGLLFDQEFGLLVYAPFYALAVPGFLPLLRRFRLVGAVSVSLVVVVCLTAGAWPMWRGGFNPPARFLVPLLGPLALAAAFRLRQGFGAGAAMLVGWGLFLGLSGAVEPSLVHRDRDGTAPLLRAEAGAEEWTRLLPGYVLERDDRFSLSLVWGAALLLACRRGSQDAAALPLVVAVALASSLGTLRTGGRDAVRVLGGNALAVPSARLVHDAPAEWGPDSLPGGGFHDPRHGDTEVGSRLPLGPRRYRLALSGEPFPGMPPPELVVSREVKGKRPSEEKIPLQETGGGELTSEFEVGEGVRAVTLSLRGGGPFRISSVRLDQPARTRSGLRHEEREGY